MIKANNITELIGRTPVVKLNRIVGSEAADIYLKLESFNPGGSVKDRIALGMIETAEREGKLKPDSTIVEPTSGNTGIGLAMIAAAKGYKIILVMPETFSVERRKLMKAYGADFVLTPGSLGMKGAIEKAYELAQNNPDYFLPQQFENEANPAQHSKTTAIEIIDQMEGKVDYFISAAGTGGTVTGVGRTLKSVIPGVKIVAVEPEASPVLSGGKPGPHKIQGIGPGFVPKILDVKVLDEIFTISNEEAFQVSRRLAKEEGILVGISSGAAVAAAIKIAQREGKGKTIVAIAPDTGERYLTTELFEL
jgi:cysteine synthase A